MTVRLRRAGVEDAEGIVALERGIPELPHWGLAEYRGYIEQEGRLLLLAVEEATAELLGFAAATLHPQPVATAELDSVAVVTGARRRGVGRKLCAEAICWCRAGGATEVELEVRAASRGAQALYRSLGFGEVGRRARYYAHPTDDAVLMVLPLSAPDAIYNCGNYGA